MSRFCGLLLCVCATIAGQPCLAQSGKVPGVTEVAPGVREIDGAKVPTTRLTASSIKAAIEKDRSFKVIKKLFDVEGIASPGPAGTTTYMYKMHDPETEKDMVVILFVKGSSIVDYLIS